MGLYNTCIVSRKLNISRVIPRLFGWVYKTLGLFPLAVDDSVVVMGARLNPMGSQFLCSSAVLKSLVNEGWWSGTKSLTYFQPVFFTFKSNFI